MLRFTRYATLCITACALLSAGGAQATDGKNRYLILGQGSDHCADVLANLKQGEKLNNQAAVIIYSNWLAGNLSAYNRDSKNTYSILGDADFVEAFKWTVSYCEAHPGSIYSGAADAFIAEYRADRYTSMPVPKAKAAPDKEDDNDDDDDDNGK